MEQPNCQVGNILLLKKEADHKHWHMTRIVNVYNDSKGNVCVLRLLLGASDKSGNLATLGKSDQ